MQDLKMLEKLEKDLRKTKFSVQLTISDLPRLEARDLPDDGTLPNGERVIFGAYTHTIRGDQVMRRWMVQCPYCLRPCRVLYCLSGQYMCRHCTGLPYRTEIASRTARAGIRLGKVATDAPEVTAIQRALWHDMDSDAEYHNRRRATYRRY